MAFVEFLILGIEDKNVCLVFWVTSEASVNSLLIQSLSLLWRIQKIFIIKAVNKGFSNVSLLEQEFA